MCTRTCTSICSCLNYKGLPVSFIWKSRGNQHQAGRYKTTTSRRTCRHFISKGFSFLSCYRYLEGKIGLPLFACVVLFYFISAYSVDNAIKLETGWFYDNSIVSEMNVRTTKKNIPRKNYVIRSFNAASSKMSFGFLLISSFASWNVENSFKLIDVAVWMIAFSFASVRLIIYSLIW